MLPLELWEFDFLLPRRIVCGWGKRREVGSLARTLGTRAFLVDGSRTLRNSAHWSELLAVLEQAGVQPVPLVSAQGEPTIADVDAATQSLLAHGPRSGDCVIGVGGGSALDLAKAVAALATNHDGGSVRDFLEGVGTGEQLTAAPLPMMAIPTTAGTGSEATKNAVISVDSPPCKKSLRADSMLPAVAVIDPELTVLCPREQTAYCGMDALTQLIESALSRRSSPAVRKLATSLIAPTFAALPKAVTSPEDREARTVLAVAALVSGITLANGGLGLAHGVAAALGALCDVPHGLACAVLLPVALRTNREVSRTQLIDIGQRLPARDHSATGSDSDRLLSAVESLFPQLGLPTQLRDLGVQREQIPALVAGSRGNSMNGNPRELSDAELTEILEGCW